MPYIPSVHIGPPIGTVITSHSGGSYPRPISEELRERYANVYISSLSSPEEKERREKHRIILEKEREEWNKHYQEENERHQKEYKQRQEDEARLEREREEADKKRQEEQEERDTYLKREQEEADKKRAEKHNAFWKEEKEKHDAFWKKFEEKCAKQRLKSRQNIMETYGKTTVPLVRFKSFSDTFSEAFTGEQGQPGVLRELADASSSGRPYVYENRMAFSQDDVQVLLNLQRAFSAAQEMEKVFYDDVFKELGLPPFQKTFGPHLAVFYPEENGVDFIQVGVREQVVLGVLKHLGTKGQILLRDAWRKTVQVYKKQVRSEIRHLKKELKLDQKTLNKIPKELGEVKLAKDSKGLRYGDKTNSIRLMKGRPDAQNPSQKVDYIKIISNGKVVDKNGAELAGEVIGLQTKRNPDVHIPLSEWKNWQQWNKP